MTKQTDSLLTRLQRAWRSELKPKPGYERTAEGKTVRTPDAGEFFGNLEKTVSGRKPKPKVRGEN